MISSFSNTKKLSFRVKCDSSTRFPRAYEEETVDFLSLETGIDTLDDGFLDCLSVLDTVRVKEVLGFEIADIEGLLREAACFF